MKLNVWRKNRYAVYKINIHLVFSVKYRKKVITDEILFMLKDTFNRVCSDVGCDMIEFGGESDHVHLLVSISPQVPIWELVRKLKGASSYEIRKKFGRQIRRKLWGKHLWSPSYCVVSCGGASLDVVKRYIENQGRA